MMEQKTILIRAVIHSLLAGSIILLVGFATVPFAIKLFDSPSVQNIFYFFPRFVIGVAYFYCAYVFELSRLKK